MEEWDDDAQPKAIASMPATIAAYLLGEPLLGDYLEEGLSQFGFSVRASSRSAASDAAARLG